MDTVILRRLLILLSLISLFSVSLCFSGMRIPGDWRFKTAFNMDWRFQDSGVPVVTVPGPAKIYDNGKIAKIYDNETILQIYKYWKITEDEKNVRFEKADGSVITINF